MKEVLFFLVDDNFLDDLPEADRESIKSLTEDELLVLEEELVKARNDLIREEFYKMNRVSIPRFGHFKIKEGRKIAKQEKERLYAKEGYSVNSKIDKDDYLRIKKEVSKKVLKETNRLRTERKKYRESLLKPIFGFK